jgi:hypothetical protein
VRMRCDRLRNCWSQCERFLGYARNDATPTGGVPCGDEVKSVLEWVDYPSVRSQILRFARG